MASPELRFADVYRRKLWASHGVLSGEGSRENHTRVLRDWLEDQAAAGIRTVLDLGCGDLEWVSHCEAVTSGLLAYRGVDVVPALIRHHERVFPWFSGECRDLEGLPKIEADVVLLKDVLFHLCNGAAQQILMNVAAGSWRRLLVTTDPAADNTKRRNLRTGGAMMPLNVEALGVLGPSAYCLPRPGGGCYAVWGRESRNQKPDTRAKREDAWEILVTTHADKGTPHMEELRLSNPSARVHVVNTDEGAPSRHEWRNNDARVRAWWRANRSAVHGTRVAWLDWDALVTAPLPDIHPAGLTGREIKGEGWRWWGERQFLPEYSGNWIGVVPLGVTFWNAALLDALADPRYDEAYARDVFCELRTPTICRHAGFPVETVDLPGVKWHAVTPRDLPGIWHAVKP